MELTRKRVLVIGGSSGIGFAVARRAATLGGTTVDVMALDGSRPETLAQLAIGTGDVDHLVSTVGGAMGAAFSPTARSDLPLVSQARAY